MNYSERAREIISKILYLTIATVGKDGKPWNTPVYSAFDDQYNFYWASWTENQHSQNIAHCPDVFLAIYDSTVPEGTGEGVYIQAQAFELSDPTEIQHAMNCLYRRKNKHPRQVSEFQGAYPRRIYKAAPAKCWMNTEGEVGGEYVDKRVEVGLN